MIRTNFKDSDYRILITSKIRITHKHKEDYPHMEKRTPLGDMIYEDLITDIYTGLLKTGSSLPTLKELCEKYEVGRNTVLGSITRLKADHYISGGKGKPYKVIFDYENPYFREQYIRHALRRRDTILQVLTTFQVIMPDITAYAVELLPFSRHMVLNSLAGMLGASFQKDESAVIEVLISIYGEILAPLDNHLLESLFFRMLFFLQTPISQEEQKKDHYRYSLRQLGKSFGHTALVVISRDCNYSEGASE